MGQTRLFLRLNRADTTLAFDLLESVFEDDGLPLSVLELEDDESFQEMSIYTDGEADAVAARAEAALTSLGIAERFDREALPDIDWVSKSLEGLRPVRAGRFLVHGLHDRDKRRIGDLAIEIEAGLAFGTGHHGTTAGCLQMIDTVVRRERPCNALDLGAGSAVLAIAIAKLAHIPVLATDIDPVATRVAEENARLNGVAAHIDARTAPGFHHPAFAAGRPFDLIVANILARPLMKLAPQMAQFITPGGSVILSGILERQREAVISAYVGQRFRHVTTLRREGWVTIHMKR
ncbi:MAG TPA: 50S ribosomal protein L11 methyltransferase [Mesorhizobium sp.]|jgi:ribosomal protein L11 methyltransferase